MIQSITDRLLLVQTSYEVTKLHIKRANTTTYQSKEACMQI